MFFIFFFFSSLSPHDFEELLGGERDLLVLVLEGEGRDVIYLLLFQNLLDEGVHLGYERVLGENGQIGGHEEKRVVENRVGVIAGSR